MDPPVRGLLGRSRPERRFAKGPPTLPFRPAVFDTDGMDELSTAEPGMAERGMAELNEDECWSLLGRNSVGRLAVSINNRPDIFPVNYRVDDETIVIRTAAGFKLAAAAMNSHVAFEVDELDEMRHSGSSVVVRGDAVEIERLEELLEAERLKVEPWAGGSKPRFIRLTPSAVTGRRISHR